MTWLDMTDCIPYTLGMYPVIVALVFANALPQGVEHSCVDVCCVEEATSVCDTTHQEMPRMDCHDGEPDDSLVVSPPSLPVVSESVAEHTGIASSPLISAGFPDRGETRAPPLAWQRARTVALLC